MDMAIHCRVKWRVPTITTHHALSDVNYRGVAGLCCGGGRGDGMEWGGERELGNEEDNAIWLNGQQ